MREQKRRWVYRAIGLCSVIGFAVALSWMEGRFLFVSIVGVCFMAGWPWKKLGSLVRSDKGKQAEPEEEAPVVRRANPRKSDDPEEMVEEMLSQGRYALLLRP